MLLAFAALLLVLLSFLADWYDAWENLNGLLGSLLDAVHLDKADPLTRALALALLLVVAFLLFWIGHRYLHGDDRREADAARGLLTASVRQERDRRAYLDYLSDELDNRLRSSIHHARFIDLELEEAPGATLPWHYVSHAPDDAARSFATVADAYAHYRGRFLLLGEPGSGKTTSLLHLARQLVETARRDGQAPIPVLLNLSSFDAATQGPLDWWRRELRQPPGSAVSFHEWLTRELSRLPLPGRRLAAHWSAQGNLALLLDGLDEVREDRLPALVSAINAAALDSFSAMPLIVSSRSLEYSHMVEVGLPRLGLPGAVTLQPLAGGEIDRYLASAKAPGLRDAILADPGLAELARTPLTLSMMTLAFGGLEVGHLPVGTSLVERRRHLVEHFVDRMLQRHARRKVGKPFDLNPALDEATGYSRRQVNRYLGWLAVRMSERARTSFQPRELASFLAQNTLVETWPGFVSAGHPGPSLLSESRLGRLLFTASGAAVLGSVFAILGSARLPGWTFVASLLAAVVATLIFEVVGWRALGHKSFGIVALMRALGSGLLAGALILAFTWGVLCLSVAALLPLPSSISAMGVLLATVYWFRLIRPKATAGERVIAAAPFVAGGLFSLACHYNEQPHLIWWGLVLAGFVGAGTSAVRTLLGSDDPDPWAGPLIASAVVLSFIALLAAQAIATLLLPEPSLAVVLLATSLAFGALGAVSQPTAASLAAGAIGGVALAAAPGAAFGAALGAKLSRGPFKESLPRWMDRRLSSPCLLVVLVCMRQLPIRLQGFLDYATEALLLQRSAEGYQFTHRLLRDHFALRSLTPLAIAAQADDSPRIIARLSSLGEASLPLLTELSAHPDTAIREAAVTGLGNLRAPEVVPLLEHVLSSDEAASVRCRAAAGLPKLPSEATRDAWSLALRDPSAAVRAAAVKGIGGMKPTEVVGERFLLESLQGALRDPSEQVVRSTICALGSREMTRAAMDLPVERGVELLDTLGSGKGDDAARALALLSGDARARLLGLIHESDQQELSRRIRAEARKLLNGNDPTERGPAARVLGILEDGESLEALLVMSRAEKLRLREAALSALGDLGAVEAIPVLIESAAVEKMRRLRVPAVESLGKVLAKRRETDELPSEQYEAIETALICALSSGDSDVSIPAAQALEHAPGLRAARALIKSLDRGTAASQDAAMASLSSMGEVVAADDLLHLLAEPRLRFRLRWGTSRLMAHHPDAEAVLLEWLHGAPSPVQVGAALSLGAMRSANAVPHLATLLCDTRDGPPESIVEYFGRPVIAPDEAACYALVLIGEPAVAALARLVKEGAISPTLAAELLGQVAGPAAARAFKKLLRSPFVRRTGFLETLINLRRQHPLPAREAWMEMLMATRLGAVPDE